VSMFDGKKWVSWTHKDGLGAPNTDNLPFSANTGLGTRTRHDLSVSSEGPATYNPNYVFSILSAKDGSVWAGTWGGGAARWDGKRWTNLTSREGLAGNIVYSLAQDRSGAIWLGTDKGMENRLVPPTGIPLDRIGFAGLRGKGALGMLRGAWQLLRGFGLAEVLQQHHAAPEGAHRVGQALAHDVEGRAVDGLEHAGVAALGVDVAGGRDAQAAG